MGKGTFTSKTIWLGILTILIPNLIAYAQGDAWLREWLSNYPSVLPIITSAIGVAIIILRYATGEPMNLTIKARQWQRERKRNG